MKFKIDSGSLENISVPDVKLDSHTENVATMELTSNCGCGGRCLSSTTYGKKRPGILFGYLGRFLF